MIANAAERVSLICYIYVLYIHINIRSGFIFFFLLLTLPFRITSQSQLTDSLLIFKTKELDINKNESRSPYTLAKSLSEGITDDTEKFSKLFGWVAHNIRYNYRAYFSPGGTYSCVRSILKHRSAICVGYAELMDSLCFYSGIPNVSVYGYSKDEFFDPHDSLYIDNHAWNAVKLNGLWYVYDVTWSNGVPQFTLNAFNRWKLKVLNKAEIKYKLKKIPKRRRFFEKDDCGNEYNSPAFYQKQKAFNKFYLWFIRYFNVKYKLKYTKAVTSDYYLTQPEVFAITHFPDDAIWSLLPNYTIQKFENDSAVYFLHDSVYKQQVREGKECKACDEYFEADQQQRNLILKNESFKCNAKNYFVQSLCDHKSGDHYISLAASAADSDVVVNYIDTALTYYNLSNKELKSTKTNIIKEFKQLTVKNLKKKNILLVDNLFNRSFVRGKVRSTLENKRKFYRMLRRSVTLSKIYRRKKKNLYGIKAKVPKQTPLNNQRVIENILEKLESKKVIIDSLRTMKDTLMTSYNKEIRDLSLNIWQEILKHDTLFKPLEKCIRLRRQMIDDYKKLIVDQRNQLSYTQIFYSMILKSGVYGPANRVNIGFYKIIKIIDQKNSLEAECLKLKQSLVKQGALSVNEFEVYQDDIASRRPQDYCWIRNYLPYITSNYKGFEKLRGLQKNIFGLIGIENHIERMRYYYLNKEYLRRDRKHKNIVANNKSLASKKMNKAIKRKRSILKKKMK